MYHQMTLTEQICFWLKESGLKMTEEKLKTPIPFYLKSNSTHMHSHQHPQFQIEPQTQQLLVIIPSV